MLMLHRGNCISDVARTLCCARSSVGAGLAGSRCQVLKTRNLYPQDAPDVGLLSISFGYQRSRWSTELLAIKVNEITGCQLHAGTVRR